MLARTFITVGLVGVLATVAATQESWTPPLARDGHPNLEGVWYFGSATPLERPRDLAGKSVLTPEEARAFEEQTAARISSGLTVHPPDWLDYGTKVVADRRTSLIVEPADGRIPALTAERRAAVTQRQAERPKAPTGPEDFTIGERCIVFGGGPPVLPGPYNNNLQIVQTPDAVLLHTEMIHDARIVPLSSKPALPSHIRGWLGVSRGRWDGQTLVVETTNFHEKVSFRGSDQNLKVTERFTLQGAGELRYEFTIEDPTAFTAPWTGMLVMTRSKDQMYEYACHEGNYGMENALKTARFEEEQAPRRDTKP